MVMIVALGSLYLVATVGDGCSYCVSPEIGMQLPEDHSKVQELIRPAAMMPETAKRSLSRRQLSRCLGQKNSIDVDLFPAGPRLDVLDPPCAPLLGTDGLPGYLAPKDIAADLKAPVELAAQLHSLISLELERGATYNITVAVVQRSSLSSANTRVGLAAFGVSSRGEM
jgi:serine/threonine protein phosphatase PrpC